MSRKAVYEGKAKIIYEGPDPNTYIAYFKDDATAFDGQKKDTLQGKGVVNTAVSAIFFEHLEKQGIQTHFIQKLSERELLVKKVEIVPIEAVMRNKAAGSICKRLGLERGLAFKKPIFETYYKNDALHDPLITRDHVFELGLASAEQLGAIETISRQINDELIARFSEAGIELYDFKIEFGINHKGELLLADEISPDTCRLINKKTGEILDKDRFRQDLGRVEESYEAVLQMLQSS